MKKSEQTKKHLLETAIGLFKQKGFEQTTMRQIAQSAQMALGSAYYYFPSKEAFVLEHYQVTQGEFFIRAQPIISSKKKLEQKLKDIFHLQLTHLQDQRSFLHTLALQAIDSRQSLSPFGRESRALRQQHMAIFASLLAEQKNKITRKEEQRLAFSLWLLQMALIWLWLQDKSHGQVRSKNIASEAAQLFAGFINMRKYKIFSSLAKSAVRMSENIFLLFDQK